MRVRFLDAARAVTGSLHTSSRPAICPSRSLGLDRGLFPSRRPVELD